MLGKRTRPTIGKLVGVIRSSVIEHMTSPRSPLECRMQSPRAYDQSGLVLGLAVALDKPTNMTYGCRGEVLAKYAICGQFSTRSNPIPVSPSGRKDINECSSNDIGKFSGQVIVEMELQGFDEEFTYVTCHGGPNNKATTRVYYDGGEFGRFSPDSSELKILPEKLTGDRIGLLSDSEMDFLSSCHLCRKTLHGKDIYMYRGEKAFCSTECRQREIGMDERKEKCRLSEITRPIDHLATSPCNYSGRSQIFFSAGIIAV